MFHVLGLRRLTHDKIALFAIIQGDILRMTEQEIDSKVKLDRYVKL